MIRPLGVRKLAGVLAAAALALFLGSCDDDPVTPPPPALTAQIAGNAVHLSWSGVSGGSFKLLRRLNVPPTGPTDGAAVVVLYGAARAADDPLPGLLPNTTAVPRTYHYAVFSCDSMTACDSLSYRAQISPTLVQCLQAGGYTIFFRHALADVCTDHLELGPANNTTVPDWWKSCDPDCQVATARQINATTGRQQAITIGNDIRARGIPIGRVLSSEFCRCVTTAQQMAFGPPIEQDQGITYFVYDEANRCATVTTRVATAPSPGTNTAIIGHLGFAVPPGCAFVGDLNMGEAHIYKPDGMGAAIQIQRVVFDAWDTLP